VDAVGADHEVEALSPAVAEGDVEAIVVLLEGPDCGRHGDRQVAAALARSHIRPDLLRLEITEGSLMADPERARRILDQLHREAPDDADLVDRYLAEIVPGIASVRQKVIGPRETLEFTQAGTGSRRGTTFLAQSMSDGTLRSLGILLAILQQSSSRPSRSQDRLHRLVAIEEPETALHPAATSCVLEVMLEASSEAQIILTSHSPDLLDHDELPADAIRPVVMEDGATRIGVLAHGARSALRDHLYTAGELMRMR